LSQIWDRFRDRAFFLSQQVVRNVRDQADVVLYLVNASEAPEDAGYLAPELGILEWIGKPVIVLINQTGRPRPHEEELADEARWRAALGARPIIRAVTTLDAFARCWVQERALLDVVGDALPETRRVSYRRLVDAWQARRRAQFEDAMTALAAPIAAAACDREGVAEAAGERNARDRSQPWYRPRRGGEGERARDQCDGITPRRRDRRQHRSTDRDLRSRGPRETRRARAASLRRRARCADQRGKAAMMGGVVSGALTGLAADLAAGGPHARRRHADRRGAGGARRCGHRPRREHRAREIRRAAALDDAFLSGLVASALLRYLAVAHYGRGRGDWAETEYPPFWSPLVAEILEQHRYRLTTLWAKREPALRRRINRERIARDSYRCSMGGAGAPLPECDPHVRAYTQVNSAPSRKICAE
jgi:hypothetical protein